MKQIKFTIVAGIVLLALAGCGGGGSGSGEAPITSNSACVWGGSNWSQCNWQ